jgi:hypothetical protein
MCSYGNCVNCGNCGNCGDMMASGNSTLLGGATGGMSILEAAIPYGATVPLAIDADMGCCACNGEGGRRGATAGGSVNREPERIGDINPGGDPP